MINASELLCLFSISLLLFVYAINKEYAARKCIALAVQKPANPSIVKSRHSKSTYVGSSLRTYNRNNTNRYYILLSSTYTIEKVCVMCICSSKGELRMQRTSTVALSHQCTYDNNATITVANWRDFMYQNI